MMVMLIGFFALAVDVGDMLLHRGQLQNAADSAALAGAGALFVYPETLETDTYAFPYLAHARTEAQKFVRANEAAQYGPPEDGRPPRPLLDINPGSVVIGRWQRPVVVPDEWFPNAVEVTVPLSDAQMLFGFLKKFHSVKASAVAHVSYPHLLPFAMYKGAWTGEAVQMYPGPWDGVDLPPGNFGTLHIGPSGGGTTELRDQIANGVGPEDLAPYAGRIESGTMIHGDTGLSVGMEAAFVGGEADDVVYPGIIGESRFLPLYSTATKQGAISEFTIVGFVAVKVVDVHLKGQNKYITVEPCKSLSELVGLHLVR